MTTPELPPPDAYVTELAEGKTVFTPRASLNVEGMTGIYTAETVRAALAARGPLTTLEWSEVAESVGIRALPAPITWTALGKFVRALEARLGITPKEA